MSYLWRIKNFSSKTVNFFCFRDLTMEAKIFRTDRYIFLFSWATYEKTENFLPRTLYKTPVFSGYSEGLFWRRQSRDQKVFQKHYTKAPVFSPNYERHHTADMNFTERRCTYGADQKPHWPRGGMNLYSFLYAQRAWGRVCKFAKVLEGIAYFF